MTDIYRVDLTAGEVEQVTPEEEALRRLQARLRKLADRINEAPEGPERASLKKEYRELLQRVREFGDADVKESYPGDDLTEEAAVHDAVADFAPALGDLHDAVDLAEPGDRPDEPAGSYFGTDEFMRMVGEPDAPPTADQELHDALRAQAEADSFGDDSPDVIGDDATDDELWDAFASTWGIEEGQK